MAEPNDIFEQVKRVWSKLTGGQKAAVIATTLLVFGGILASTLWAGRAEYRQLAGGIASQDLAPLIARLEDEGITDYKVVGDGASLLVNVDDVERARTALYRSGLLTGSGGAGNDADGDGLFSTGNLNSRELTFTHARKSEKRLAAMLMNFDYIEFAKITISPPVERYFKSGRKPAKASVVIKPRNALSHHQIQSIAHVVAAGVQDLSADQVAISDTNGIVLRQPDGMDPDAPKAPDLRYQAALETRKAQQVQETLDRAYGPHKVFVNVSVDLDWTRSQVREKRYDPDGKVVREKSKTESSRTKQRRLAGGAPGNAALNNGANGGGGAADGSDTDSTTTETSDFSSTESESVTLGGVIKRMTVGVIIHEELDAHRQDIADTVKASVGFNETRGDVISIHSTTIEPPAVDDIEVLKEDAESQAAIMVYAEYGLYALVGILFIFFSLRTIKKAKKSLREILENSMEEEKEPEPPPPLSLEESVLESVKQNSELAGRSLRRWLYEGVSE